MESRGEIPRRGRLLGWNAALALMTVIGCAVMLFFDHGDGLLVSHGAENLKYFTVLSNVLEGLASLILVLVLARRSGPVRIPHGLYLLKLAAGVAVTVTFLVVALFFGPWVGYAPLYRDANLWFHLLIPLAAILEFVLAERYDRAALRETLWGVVPALAYGLVYTGNVLVNGPGQPPHANDFYGFVHWGLPVGFGIFGGILLVSWLSALLLRWASGLGNRQRAEKPRVR